MSNRYTTIRREQREITAYHEAAHAVFYVAYMESFRYVTIRGHGEVLGQVHGGGRRRRRLDILLPICLAGPCAEQLFLMRRGEASTFYEDTLMELPDCDPVDLDGDWAKVYDIAEKQGWFGAKLARLSEDVIEDVFEWWPQITTLAEALLSSPRALTYREVCDLVGSIPENAA